MLENLIGIRIVCRSTQKLRTFSKAYFVSDSYVSLLKQNGYIGSWKFWIFDIFLYLGVIRITLKV